MAQEGIVCVTGASGYIGGHIIKILLEKGYKVRGVIRDKSKEDKYDFLKKLPQKENQLEFFEADLQSGDYEKIFAGATSVIHTATPYIYTAPNPQTDIVDPAVNGTVNAIKAALKCGVKRIVITSSGGAILHFPVAEGYVFTNKDWNTNSSLTNNPYFYSKKLAEEAAWKLYDEHKAGIELVVVNPLFVIGPTMSPVLNTSIQLIKRYLTGENQNVQPGGVAIVDVRDVAKAHVIAMEHPKAAGQRLICSNTVLSWNQLVTKLKEFYPQFNITDQLNPAPFTPFLMDTKPLQELGLDHFHSLDESVRDTVQSLLQLGVVTDPDKK